MTAPRSTKSSVHGPISRRLIGLFILCSVVPTTWFAFFSEGRVTRSLLTEADRDLATTAKRQGVQIFERLTTVAERTRATLDTLASRSIAVEDDLSQLDPLRSLVSAFGVMDSATESIVAGDEIEFPHLVSRDLAHLLSGRALLHEQAPSSPESSGFVFIHAIGADRWLVSELRHEAIWGPEDTPTDQNRSDPNRIARDRIDVFTLRGPISADAIDRELEISSILSWGARDLEPFEWTLEDEVLRGSLWTLPLEFKFGCSPWTVVASTNRAQVLAPIKGFRSTFYKLALVTTLAVCFLALRTIRRQVQPLSVILDGTRRVAAGELNTRIAVERRDEFGVLAHDFNSMAEQLERHFHTNATVRAVTEAILGASALDSVVLRLLQELPDLIPDASIEVVIDSPIGLERHRLPPGAASADPVTDIVVLNGVQQAMLHHLDDPWIEIEGDYQWLSRIMNTNDEAGPAWLFPMTVKGEFLGGIVICDALGPDRRHFVRQIANQGAIALSNARLIASLESMSWETLCVLARTVDEKSPWTAGHSDRVAQASRRLAVAMEIDEAGQERIYRAALLHDVGKVGTPVELLDKKSPLTAEEYEVVQQHVLIGCRILGSVETFSPLLAAVRSHHERIDGNGYPDGLAGDDIPLDARIVAIADSYDAMVSDRPYRKGLEQEEALRRIRAGSGTQFDPQCADRFLEMMASDPDALESSPPSDILPVE